MKFTSNLLGQVSRAIGLTRVGGFETTLNIPPQLNPVIVAREPLSAGNTASVPTLVQRTSVGGTTAVTQANAGGTSIEVCRLAAGVWEIHWHAMYTANFISVASNFGGALILTQTSGAQQYFLCAYLPAGQAAQQVSSDSGIVTVSSAVDLSIVITVGANGVGQTHSLIGNVICHKLL